MVFEPLAVGQEFFVPGGHFEAHVAFFAALAAEGVELDAGVHDVAVIVARLAVDLLLQARQAAERLDPPVPQVELALGDVAGVVGDGVGDVVAGHRDARQDGHRAGALQVHGLFVSAGQLGVKVAGISPVRRDLLHRDGDFFQRVAEGGHVGQQREHPLALEGELLTHRQAKVGHQKTLDDGVGGRVDEEDRPPQDAALFERAAESQVVVVPQAHAAQDDDVGVRLEADAGEEVVVRLSGDGEDRQLLALHQRIEDVNHRDAGLDHL